MRTPKLSLAGACFAVALASAVSLLTGETLILGTESLLSARAAGVTTAETALAQATTALDAAKGAEARREADRARLTDAVDEARRHSEEVGREPVGLQNNPNVSAYRSRKGGWIAPGSSAAGSVAAANAKAQAEHAARSATTETSLGAARAELAAWRPVDLTGAEADVVAAQQAVERERAANPMTRLAASLFRTDTANLKAEDYQWLRRTVSVSVGAILAFGTLAAGLISALPERSDKPGKLSRAIRAMVAARRKRLRRIQERVEYRDRVKFVHVPVDVLGRVLNPDAKTP
jgi:hypothetical protein